MLRNVNRLAKGYTPARLCTGKEWVIKFYCVDPQTGKRKRHREKLNHIPDVKTRREYAKQRIQEINGLLALGWNPDTDTALAHVGKSVQTAAEEFLRSKVRLKRRKDTMRSYRSNIDILLTWLRATPTPDLPVEAFNADMARAYMQWRFEECELSPKSFNNNHTFCITLWNWFAEKGYVKDNPFSVVKKKELDPEESNKRPPEGLERAIIRKYMEEHTPRFFTFCLLCFHMAIRPKEAFMLMPQHINLDIQTILIPRDIAKNKRTMGVAIPDVMMPQLRALDIASQNPSHYVFSTDFEPGSVLRDSRYSGKAWSRMREATGLSTDVTMYQLKHAGGEQLSRDGVGGVDLMNHFRHHDLSETSTYVKRAYKEGVRPVITKATRF
ncbi:MAG TPA: tyrosine-type recombinase/integrase [Flavobacteriales bacterium]|nr:tyrosine-type recombinase/integrase [Flavobacteriales bacterium]